jgi:hypothetical protein
MKLGFLFPTNKPTYSSEVGLLDLPNNALTKKNCCKDEICRLVRVNIANPMKVDLLGLLTFTDSQFLNIANSLKVDLLGLLTFIESQFLKWLKIMGALVETG